jgi:protein disulfide-isomerase
MKMIRSNRRNGHHLARLALLFGLTLCAAACGHDTAKQAAPATAHEIAWREGDVDDALAEARESGKPLMLYWGAKWCPPCNQLKSTLFKDPDFIAETQRFVAVHLDGDSPGAQKWGERFGISGYPTVILLKADGSELTRLSSGATVTKLAEVLHLAASRTISTEALLTRGETDPKSLLADDWAILGAFDWQNDPKHFGDQKRVAALLPRLAAVAPTPALQHRFALLGLIAGADEGDDDTYKLTADQQAGLAKLLPVILANPEEVKANRQELSFETAPLVLALNDVGARTALGMSLTTALDQLFADKALSVPDRLATVQADLTLAGKHPSVATLAKVRSRVAWADKAATDPIVRQSVISNAAELLHDAGDDAGATKMLEAELKRSASPYYYMLDLSSMAEAKKDNAAAIGWARKAYETAEGPATRVQWAIAYSKTVLRLAPNDKKQVEASANAVLDELGRNPGGYYQRTGKKAAAWGTDVAKWSGAHGGDDILARLRAKMAGVCEKQGDKADACRSWSRTA